MDNIDLKNIKKHYGEKFMHLCRSLFPIVLEKEGLLYKVISENFAPSHALYDQIEKDGMEPAFKSLVFNLAGFDEQADLVKTGKTPEELLDEAGYILYPECKTEEDIQKFKKYYAKGEELCTFKGGRLKTCRVWFAIKKNVDKIKREDFTNPERQDKYGTSVISIQFTKNSFSMLSIKNRYNHTVFNPDATFSNNLENISKGLTSAFIENYELDLIDPSKRSFIQGNFVRAIDGKIYVENTSLGNIYYCDNNVVVDNYRAVKFDPRYTLLIDNYVVDFSKKKIYNYYDATYNRDEKKTDAFVESIGEIEDIKLTKLDLGKKQIEIKPKNGEVVKIVINFRNEIVEYYNENAVEIGDNFLDLNDSLEKLMLPNVEVIGNEFLFMNRNLRNVLLPELKKVGNFFLGTNQLLQSVFCPNLESVGDFFLESNTGLREIDLPKAKMIGDRFIYSNRLIDKVNLPQVVNINKEFLSQNELVTKLDFPMLKRVGVRFMSFNKVITNVNMPQILVVGDDFLFSNGGLISLDLPNALRIGNGFLCLNENLSEINLPQVTRVGENFLNNNVNLTKIDFPKLKLVGDNFLKENKKIEEINLPSVKSKAVLYYRIKRLQQKSYNEKQTDDLLK